MEKEIQPFNATTIKKAEDILATGGIVSFPTETVYALAADATNDAAIQRIYAIKDRNRNKPLSLLLKDIGAVQKLCYVDTRAKLLLETYAPGSLTLILPLKEENSLSPFAHNKSNTIGVRIPNHKGALALLHKTASPLVGTSANPSGMAEATNAEEVQHIFGEAVDLIISDDTTHCTSIASTVLDLTQGEPVILRQGAITEQDITNTLLSLK